MCDSWATCSFVPLYDYVIKSSLMFPPCTCGASELLQHSWIYIRIWNTRILLELLNMYVRIKVTVAQDMILIFFLFGTSSIIRFPTNVLVYEKLCNCIFREYNAIYRQGEAFCVRKRYVREERKTPETFTESEFARSNATRGRKTRSCHLAPLDPGETQHLGHGH